MAVFVAHEPCPACGSRDNLGRYSDGSAWCFGCHYVERRNRLDSNFSPTLQIPAVEQPDLCFDFPEHVVNWLGKYDISVAEAIKHGWKYSPRWDQLVFTFRDEEGNIACTQARNFRPGAKQKYYNQGSPANTLPIFYGPKKQRTVVVVEDAVSAAHQHPRTLVVVEDAVSAAKIARQCDAMPCLGSYLPSHKLVALKGLEFEELIVWLDSDKLKEAREIAQRAKWLGFNSRVVYTKLDPKEYSDVEIKQFLFSL